MNGIARYTYELSKALLSKSRDDPFLHISLSSLKYPQFSSILERHYSQMGFENAIKTSMPSLNRACELLIDYSVPFSKGKVLGKLVSQNAKLSPDSKIVHWPLAMEHIPGRPKGLLECVTVYDVIPLTHPELCSSITLKTLTPILQHVASSADHFFAISEFTKQQFCDYFNMHHDRISVVPLAADPRTFYLVEDQKRLITTRERYEIPNGEYILSLAALDPRKNLRRLIESFSNLLSETKRKDLYLVLAGEERPGITSVLKEMKSSINVREKVVFTGYIQESDLAALYSDALFFANPSLIEGFGLPPLEAMQCGCPVITSNTTSIPEVTGSAAILIDPSNSADLTDAMHRMLTDDTLREALSTEGIKQAAKFSWRRCAEMTSNVYSLLT